MSMGPVGFGDAAGYSNASLLLATCMSNGTLLQPDRPLAFPDSFLTNYSRLEQLGDVRVAHSALATGAGDRAYYVLAWQLAADLALAWSDLYPAPGAGAEFVALSYSGVAGFGGCVDGAPLSACAEAVPFPGGPLLRATGTGADDWRLSTLAPVLSSGWVLLGELDKAVPLSARRFGAIEQPADGSLTVALAGAPGERVRVAAAQSAGTVSVLEATVAEDGTAILRFVA